MESDLSIDAVTERLTDAKLLKNYCVFGTFHRPKLASVLFNALDDDLMKRRSIGIQLLENYVALLEDVALWFFVLKDWRNGRRTLFELLDETEIRESVGNKFSSEAALAEISNWTIADMRREFGLPTDEDLRGLGLGRNGLRSHIGALRDILGLLRESLTLRTADSAVLVLAYNKLKHGLIAIEATENSTVGASVIVASRRGGRRGALKVGWIPTDDAELAKIVNSTLWGAEALCSLLNIVYIFRFDREWEVPHWPFKAVHLTP